MIATAKKRLTERINRLLLHWMFQLREVETGEVFLKQRRVFIVPTRPGLALGVVLVILFIGSVNYSLSLGFVLTFLIASCALVDMHLTFRNLAHLYLLPGQASPVFAGEEARFDVHLINRYKYDRYGIWLGFFAENLPDIQQSCDVAASSTTTVSLHVRTIKRGWQPAPRIRLQTRFPLGLLRSWSYWFPDMKVLVFPYPEPMGPPLPAQTVIATGKGSHGQAGNEDFSGVRPYQAGDALKHLAWRQIARIDMQDGGTLVTKHFEGGEKGELCIDFSSLPANMDIEMRISRMAHWVLNAEQSGIPYAFHLGAHRFDTALGPAHQNACLTALALYEGR